jgi:integrase
MAHLTARGLQSLKPERTRIEVWDETLPGFGVRVAPTGRKTFVLMYRHQRRLRRLTLGIYPRLSLADARENARKALINVGQGTDPAQTKHDSLRAETFGELADLFIEKHAKRHKRSWRDDDRWIKRELSTWKHTKATEVTRSDVRTLLEAIVDRPAPILANRILALIRKIFNFGISRDLLTVNPCWQLERPAKERPRERVLNEEEIRGVWVGLDAEAAAGRIPTATYYKLRLVTAQRGQEIERMRWRDVDPAEFVWTIPGEDSKNGLSHRVPLSSLAWRLLEELRAVTVAELEQVNVGRDRKKWPRLEPSQYAFPSPRRVNGDQPWGRNLQNAVDRIREAAGVQDWTGHDLRRTAASHMTGSGIPRLVVAKILNHVETGVTSIYDRHSYDAEKRGALEAWGRKLEAIVQGKKKPTASVVPIGSRRVGLRAQAGSDRSRAEA